LGLRVTSSYEIRIKGKVGEPVLETFGELHASIKPAETVLRGPVADQAALHGLLDRIQALAATIPRHGPERCPPQRGATALIPSICSTFVHREKLVRGRRACHACAWQCWVPFVPILRYPLPRIG
jgi:hypothetical protein